MKTVVNKHNIFFPKSIRVDGKTLLLGKTIGLSGGKTSICYKKELNSDDSGNYDGDMIDHLYIRNIDKYKYLSSDAVELGFDPNGSPEYTHLRDEVFEVVQDKGIIQYFYYLKDDKLYCVSSHTIAKIRYMSESIISEEEL